MKKILLSVFLGAALSIGANAQLTRNCGTMQNLERLEQQDPSIKSQMEQIEAQTQQWIASNGGAQRGTIYRIPVVVHVVYNTSTQNISDAQIQSQITILNQDFRRTNADKVNTPSTFTSVAADAEIEFCLATVSPTGAATSGITRTSTTVTSFTYDDKVKYTSQGGKDAWDATKYMNIWVCNLGGGLLGYAQFPGGPAATDGVVIGYNYFGNTGTAVAPFNKGRTATHEVGHYLNLSHIWGDATCGNDYVSDTPVHYTDNGGCPSHPKSNSCGTSAEMFMNYMDYTDDGCMNLFSTGQANRMRAVLASGGARYSLTTSTACGSTTATYCSAKSTNTSYEWISNVKLNTINNTTTGSGGYADYTGITTSLTKGSAYTVTLTPAFASSTYTEYFKVFIDYNNDKDFDDSGELVYTSSGTTSAVSGSFTVPSTAVTAKVRMRVIMKDGSISGPCEQFTYGEVEDYSVDLVTSTTTTCGIPASLSATSITSSSATLNWGAVSGASSYNVRYKKASLTTWATTTSTSTSKSISGLSASTTYEFQVQAVCSGTGGSYSASKTFSTGATTTTADKILTIGTGTGNTNTAPYGTYYMDERVQFIITKEELVAAGYTSANNIIKALAFNVYSASSQVMNGFTIKIGHTTASSFGSTSFLAPAMTTVYSANFTASTGWKTHTFSTGFAYNGSSHVLVDICWNNSTYTTDSKVYYTATSAYRSIYKKTDVSAGGICTTTSGTRTYNRPNMKITLGASTAKTTAKEITEEEVMEEVTEEPVSEITKTLPMIVNLSPNPANNIVNIEVANVIENDAVELHIYDLQGRLVISRNFNGASKQPVSIDALPSGLYQVIVRSGETMKTQKLVVTR